MSIKQDYSRAYSNYLRRVARQEAKGYQVSPIKKVKNPTTESIARLDRQRAKQIVNTAKRQSAANRQLAKQLGGGKKTQHKARKAKRLTANQRSERSRKGWTEERRQRASERLKEQWQERKEQEQKEQQPKSGDDYFASDNFEIVNSIEILLGSLETRVERLGFSFEDAIKKEPIWRAWWLYQALLANIEADAEQAVIDETASLLETELIRLLTYDDLGWQLFYKDVQTDYTEDEIAQFIANDKGNMYP